MLKEGVRASAHTHLTPAAARILRLVSGLGLVAAYLWTAATPAQPVSAAGVCTGWTSNLVPPTSIRVLRTSGAAAGTVQVVPFRQYVTTVMTPEWSPGPTDAVRVGALAVKQYAWYWTIVWRGNRAADGACYDVVDTTQDQLYRPERDQPIQSLVDAVDSTWTMSLRKNGRLFTTGYRTGASVPCGADADGQILYQTSLYRCARAGMTFDQLVHRYLDPVEIVRPGVGDSTGDGLGDIVVVTPGGETTNVRTYGAGRVSTTPTVVTTMLGAPVALPLPPAQTVFRQLADVTGDRLDDMLILQRVGDDHYQIWVAASTGDAFGPPALWWDSGSTRLDLAPGGLVRFVAADFTGDGRVDAGLIVASAGTIPTPVPTPTPTPAPTGTPTPTPTPTSSGLPTPAPTESIIASAVIGAPVLAAAAPRAQPVSSVSVAPEPTPSTDPAPTVPPVPPGPPVAQAATFWLLPGTGSGFGPATPVWTGPLALDGTTVFAGDVDASGRADLIVQADMTRQPVPGVGLRYLVIRAGAANGSTPEAWLDIPDLPAAGARTVAADVNGDGRADILIDRALGATGSQLVGLLSDGRTFTPRTLWKNAGSFRWSASRIASADLDGDGRGDIVVLYNAGAAGSRLVRFLSTGTALKSAGSTIDPTLPWAGAAPY